MIPLSFSSKFPSFFRDRDSRNSAGAAGSRPSAQKLKPNDEVSIDMNLPMPDAENDTSLSSKDMFRRVLMAYDERGEEGRREFIEELRSSALSMKLGLVQNDTEAP